MMMARFYYTYWPFILLDDIAVKTECQHHQRIRGIIVPVPFTPSAVTPFINKAGD
jgi:hypothetical protein